MVPDTNSRDLLIVLLAELNLLEVRDYPLLLDTLWDYGISAVRSPCYENLSWGRSQLRGNFDDGLVIG